jgi:hypothetical protein
MKDRLTNLPASIGARLRNLARERDTNLELILRRYALERLLLRLSLSPHRDRFVLKGAMLFTVWLADPFRSTQVLTCLASETQRLNRSRRLSGISAAATALQMA